MQDAFGRTIRYLRLSITKACSMRCLYCRPRGYAPPAGPALLTPLEIEQLVSHLVANHGLEKVRLTGGEPTARPDLTEIVQRLARIDGLRDLAMTTNGLTLASLAQPLAKAGLRRVNISLDTLVPEKFQRMTGQDGLLQVLAGIDAAVAAGLRPVKLNTVVVRGENDYELSDLLLFAAWKKLEIRFIELMPMGPLASRWQQLYVSEQEMQQRLSDVVVSWVARPERSAAARKYFAGMSFGRSAQVGFVTAMSCPFCDQCNRIRIAADGAYYPCLMGPSAASLLPALRPTFNPKALDDLLMTGLSAKPEQHPDAGVAVMTTIGG